MIGSQLPGDGAGAELACNRNWQDKLDLPAATAGQDERGEAPRKPVVFDASDPELDAWNAYLATVHGNDQSATPDKRED